MIDDTDHIPCAKHGCLAERVSGGQYCDDHTIQMEVDSATLPRPVGTLALLIRGAKEKGLIQPVASGYQSA